MKKRHQLAKRRIELYKEKIGKEGYRYSDFLKNRSPLDKNINIYKVSFQVSYMSEGDEITVDPETYYIYTIDDLETEMSILNNTKDMIADMKDQHGKTLNTGLRNALRESADIDITKMRGMEKDNEIDIFNQPNKEDIYKSLLNNNIYVEGIDTGITLKKVDKNTRKIKSKSKMKFDLLHYF